MQASISYIGEIYYNTHITHSHAHHPSPTPITHSHLVMNPPIIQPTHPTIQCNSHFILSFINQLQIKSNQSPERHSIQPSIASHRVHRTAPYHHVNKDQDKKPNNNKPKFVAFIHAPIFVLRSLLLLISSSSQLIYSPSLPHLPTCPLAFLIHSSHPHS